MKGGARKGAGRKLLDSEKRRSVQIAFRVTEKEKQELEVRAEKKNLTLSKYLYTVLFN